MSDKFKEAAILLSDTNGLTYMEALSVINEAKTLYLEVERLKSGGVALLPLCIALVSQAASINPDQPLDLSNFSGTALNLGNYDLSGLIED